MKEPHQNMRDGPSPIQKGKAIMSKLAIYGGKQTVPVGTIKPWPFIDQTDKDMIMASLEGQNALVPNYNCNKFQEEFAAWNGNKYCITTNSGTAALHMGIAACGVGAGDHVLTPAYSFSASATCILQHCAVPVFVDINFDTMNMDEDKIEAAITPRTKAIVAVHLHGLAMNMDKVMAIAKKHNLAVIEDACQSYGALFKGKKVGTFGDCAAFSLNRNKTLNSGEGGLFVSDDAEKTGKAWQLRSFGEIATPGQDRDYHAHMIGWMYRNNDLTAAFGRAQLRKLDYYLKTQAENSLAFQDGIKHLSGKGLILPTVPEGHVHAWYEYVTRLDMRKIGWTGDPAVFRQAIIQALRAEGAWAGVWQRMILPAMKVFQNKNAFGLGVPWSVDNAGKDVEYIPENYPIALRHAQTHLTIGLPLRAPNNTASARSLAEAYCKVFDNLKEIDPAKIQKICDEKAAQAQKTAK